MACSRSSLSPARGLVHPAWLVCLVVLALNDHVLKGSGILPGVVTGKLSDFAGLVVAPLLLALVLRVRSRVGWALAHVAVGVVFSAIQLSIGAADAWSALMAGVGFPWTITSDPTDLVALPALLASFYGFIPAMTRPVGGTARRSMEYGVALFGLWACAATSDDGDSGEFDPSTTDDGGTTDPGWEPSLPDLSTDVYLHNGTPADLIVHIRALKDEVDLDCEAIADAPGRLLTSPLFGLAEAWTLPADTNQPVLSNRIERDCYAAHIEIDGMSPRVAFWYAGEPPMQIVPGTGSHAEAGGEIAILGDPDGGTLWSAAGGLLHEIVVDEARECAAQPDGTRLAWSDPVPWGVHTLTSLQGSPDGCWQLTLGNEWFLCVPQAAMVLAEGDVIDVALPDADASVDGTWDGVALTVVDEAGEPVVPARSIVVSVGDGVPQHAGLELAAVEDFACDREVEPTCGTVARPMHVSVVHAALGSATLSPDGTVTTLRSHADEVHLALMHAQQRYALDAGCALGTDALGPDLELVVARGAVPPKD